MRSIRRSLDPFTSAKPAFREWLLGVLADVHFASRVRGEFMFRHYVILHSCPRDRKARRIHPHWGQ